VVVGLVDNFVCPFLIYEATKMSESILRLSIAGSVAAVGWQAFKAVPVVAAIFVVVSEPLTARDQQQP
jgi:predicted PurR-regulated permease PerM